jgi:Flp pilus assembly protein TadD
VATQLQAAKAALLNVPSVRTGVAHLKALASRTLINDYEDQAVYEESQQRWQLAGRSWLRVAEGRPDDSLPLQRAAHAQLQAGVDLRKVVPVAKRAVALAPNDARAHRILARAYLAGGMQLEARRELEIARRCPAPPAPPPAASLPRHLMQRLLDRTIAYRARSE